jgi:hypothetical protein
LIRQEKEDEITGREERQGADRNAPRARIPGLPRFPTLESHVGEKRVRKRSLFDTLDEIVEVELEQVLEQTRRHRASNACAE